jgi:hypothetical protein
MIQTTTYTLLKTKPYRSNLSMELNKMEGEDLSML